MDERSPEFGGLSRRDAMKLGLISAGFSLLPTDEASAARPPTDTDGRDEGALYEGRNLSGGGQLDPRLSMSPFVEDPDYVEVAQRMSPFNLDSLFTENKRMAERNEQLAQEFEKEGHKISANTFYLRAARFYQRAVGLMPEADGRMLPAFQKLLDTYEKAWKLVPAPYERVQIPYEGSTLPGYLSKPRGNNLQRLPAVIAYGGADSTVTPTWGPEYLQRGMAYLFVDGPGQGVPLRIKKIYAPPDAEKVGKAIVDYLVSRSDVDPNRIGITGASMGGYTAPRMASGEKRLKAVAVWAGAYSLREDIFDYFPPIQDRLRWLCGAQDMAEARKKMTEFTLEGRAAEIECPMFIGYSSDDRIMDPRGAFRLNKAATRSQKVMVEGVGHDSGRIFPYRRTKADKEILMADWMAKQLGVSS
jgi:dienelactone hydrolase